MKIVAKLAGPEADPVLQEIKEGLDKAAHERNEESQGEKIVQSMMEEYIEINTKIFDSLSEESQKHLEEYIQKQASDFINLLISEICWGLATGKTPTVVSANLDRLSADIEMLYGK